MSSLIVFRVRPEGFCIFLCVCECMPVVNQVSMCRQAAKECSRNGRSGLLWSRPIFPTPVNVSSLMKYLRASRELNCNMTSKCKHSLITRENHGRGPASRWRGPVDAVRLAEKGRDFKQEMLTKFGVDADANLRPGLEGPSQTHWCR